MLVVVLPSCGRALVTIMTLGGAPRLESRSEVRSARYDSAICDWGRIWVTVSTTSFDAVKASRLAVAPRAVDLEPSGIIPREGRPEMACACSGVRTVLSHILKQEGQSDAGDNLQHKRESQVMRNVGFAGRGGNAGRAKISER